MANLTRLVFAKSKLLQRPIHTTAVKHGGGAIIPLEPKDLLPQIGNRDIVGFGANGNPCYFDSQNLPCPSLRWKENTPEVLKLREQEKGDWKQLSLEEKKDLYRASFRHTYSEIGASDGSWKSVTAWTLFFVSLTGLAMLLSEKFVYPEKPWTMSEEHQKRMAKVMILQRANHVEGIGRNFDYENNKWK